MRTELEKTTHKLTVQGVSLEIAALQRGGTSVPIVFLHGFGSTKEDYADITRHREFDSHPFLAFDAPGCGETFSADLAKVSIPFLVDTALAMLECANIDRFHLVGHSMGGLTALLLAHSTPHRVVSFVNIEGNVAPEDCFLSRQITGHSEPNPKAFFDAFIDRTLHQPAYASALYSASLRHKVRAEAVPGIFTSMVELSDHGALMDKFLALPCPRMFMYGDQNATLSYLGHIKERGVRLAEIPRCGHFPMYSNPPAMWQEIAQFIGKH